MTLVFFGLVMESKLQSEARSNVGEAFFQRVQSNAFLTGETHARKEAIGVDIVELCRIGDVAAMLDEICGDGGADAATARLAFRVKNERVHLS